LFGWMDKNDDFQWIFFEEPTRGNEAYYGKEKILYKIFVVLGNVAGHLPSVSDLGESVTLQILKPLLNLL
jgi:hypothetical protein